MARRKAEQTVFGDRAKLGLSDLEGISKIVVGKKVKTEKTVEPKLKVVKSKAKPIIPKKMSGKKAKLVRVKAKPVKSKIKSVRAKVKPIKSKGQAVKSKEQVTISKVKEAVGKVKSVESKAAGKSKRMTKEDIVASVKREMATGEVREQISGQRPDLGLTLRAKRKKKGGVREYVKTGVPGFDDLLILGIPRGNSILLAGGAGSGKTIFCLQTLISHAKHGEKCLYMSFEESENKLIQHMEDFGWDPRKLIKKKKLLVKRFNPFDITRSVDALLMQAKGELLIEVEPVVLPENFKPDFIVVDSLTAIASAFTGKEESYRIYIEQLFRFFEKIDATSFLITETEQIPKIFSKTGVEEFLADGVVVLYNLTKGNIRENAIEILKLRGAKHQKKIVAMQITANGVVVYPDQELFTELNV